jgi:hypothetical protein
MRSRVLDTSAWVGAVVGLALALIICLPEQGSAESRHDFVALSHEGCYSACPVYRITVWRTGRVVYHSGRWVKPLGTIERTIEEHDAQELLDLAHGLIAPGRATDLSGIIHSKAATIYSYRDRVMGSVQFHLNASAPLARLADSIVRVSGVKVAAEPAWRSGLENAERSGPPWGPTFPLELLERRQTWVYYSAALQHQEEQVRSTDYQSALEECRIARRAACPAKGEPGYFNCLAWAARECETATPRSWDPLDEVVKRKMRFFRECVIRVEQSCKDDDGPAKCVEASLLPCFDE